MDEENEIGLLDLLIIVAENLKLLVLGSALAAAVAFGIASTVTPIYVSQAVLIVPAPAPQVVPAPAPQVAATTPAQVALAMVSPKVLDMVAAALNLSQGASNEASRAVLAGQIKTTVSKDGVLRLEATAATPERAQAIANAVIDGWLRTTLPTKQERALLEARLSYASTALNSIDRAIARMAAADVPSIRTQAGSGELASSLVVMGELQSRYLAEVQGISRQLVGWTRDDIIKQAPTLPVRPAATNRGLIALSAALGAAFLLMVWVYVRHAWRNALHQPYTAEKLMRLRATLRLK